MDREFAASRVSRNISSGRQAAKSAFETTVERSSNDAEGVSE